MISFAFGFFGAVVAAGIFASGFFTGKYYCQNRIETPTHDKAAEQRAKEDREAFQTLMTYDINDAYGVKPNDE